MKKNEFSISELARRAGISVRTVRYYIQEGLLPAPATRGRYTIYDEGYLKRLRLIQLLKDAFMPLKEIRRQVAGLELPGVEALLEKHKKGELPLPQAPSPVSVSLEEMPPDAGVYAAKVLESQGELKHELHVMNVKAKAKAKAKATQVHQIRDESVVWSYRSKPWLRFPLAEDIELHVAGEPDHEKSWKIQQIIDLAEQLFGPPPKGGQK